MTSITKQFSFLVKKFNEIAKLGIISYHKQFIFLLKRVLILQKKYPHQISSLLLSYRYVSFDVKPFGLSM